MNHPTGTDKLTTAIMPNDIILHKPSGEEWVVCGVNYGAGTLIPCGYPFPSIADISDCELIEKQYPRKPQTKEQIDALKKANMLNYIDAASAMLHGVM